ncbi:nuclear transport factor 2 family protein [Luteimonas suaedae]|uniref:nuclear transport factor 2 family protein n=1 Tax=Luteimonas suaedae TaxID=2605430 RepID=UPI0021047228|nr:nuclear transport factor 2 family protein [Luteimonas suaedae]
MAGKRSAMVALAGWLCAAAVLGPAGCARPLPEQALREAVDDMEEAIESRDAGALQQWLADDFIGPEGMDRAGARRLATLHFMRHDVVGVTLGPREVALHGERATVRFSAALTAGSGRLLPDAARVYQVESGWRLVDGDWRMTSLRWTSVGAAEGG